MHINRGAEVKCMWGSGHMSRNSILQLAWPRTLFIIHRGHRAPFSFVSTTSKRGPIPTLNLHRLSTLDKLFFLSYPPSPFLSSLASSLDGRNNEKRSYTPARRGTGRAIFLITQVFFFLSFFPLFFLLHRLVDGISTRVVYFFFEFFIDGRLQVFFVFWKYIYIYIFEIVKISNLSEHDRELGWFGNEFFENSKRILL